jgi:SpoIID/LytB domain protein
MREVASIQVISVGLLTAPEIAFTLHRSFRTEETDTLIEGKCHARLHEGKIRITAPEADMLAESGLRFSPVDSAGAAFTLHNVIIGIDFHWERPEDQVFRGSLKLIAEGENIIAVNIIPAEEYLCSVISSEMNAGSPPDLLKAHAVISRGWLLAQTIGKRPSEEKGPSSQACTITDEEIIKWYDREDHIHFDVCADDHCQRYQGITKVSTPEVVKAVNDTEGEVLTFNGNICDTRYYKCCGGVTELFENVWEPVCHPYLIKVADNSTENGYPDIDLRDEDLAREWILSRPDAFCNTSDNKILSLVLNDYDQETRDFFRWKVRYKQEELSSLVKKKTGIDFGLIAELKSLERGVSGRIIRLEISGTKKTMVIGKELEIRKALSESHLYSSCFFTEKTVENGETFFILHGAGWGHGVGLCQIGAAVMGAKGYGYREILAHYFPGSAIEKKY